MILLKRNSLEILDRFQPETMSLQLNERQSTASLTVGPEAPEIGVGDWMQDDTDPGRGIVWRVRTVDTSYDKGTRTISLEHIVQALKDRVLFGETTPAMMGGGSTCTARQAAEYILGKCPQWTLGSFSYGTVTNAYSFNGDDLLSALTTVSGTLDDPWWEYDFSAYPFRLSIRKRRETVGSEMRMSRNISTAKVTVDRSRMYTRIYPIGMNNLHISGEYLSRNTDIYGIICKVQTDQSKETESDLRKWAQDLLKRHSDPAVSVSITGTDLSRETGESLDSIQLGRLCRVPLPAYGTTITETVSRLQWSDKIREPDKVNVTLANELQDVASIVNRLTETSSATSGSAGRAGAKKAGEDNAWFTDEADFVSMTARKVFGTDDKGQIAQIRVDGDGIHGTVQRTEKGLITAQTKIEQLEDSLSLIVDGSGVVTPAALILAINGNQSTAKLSANQISISGSTTINDIFRVESNKIYALKPIYMSGSGYAPYISSNAINTPTLELRSGDTGVALRAADVAGMVTYADVSADGLTLTLKTKDKKEINFKKATTLSGKWSGGILTVTASPQNKTLTANIYQGTVSWNENQATVPIMAVDSDQPRKEWNTERRVIVDATARYRAGQATRPTMVTNTSESPSGATDLGNELYIGTSTKSIVVTIGSNKWYCRVSR